MTLNPEEGHRLHVLSLLERGRIMTAQAAEALGITPVLLAFFFEIFQLPCGPKKAPYVVPLFVLSY